MQIKVFCVGLLQVFCVVFLAGCSWDMPTLAPYEKPKLGLQDPAPITLEKVEWFIISKENIDVYLPLINAGTLTVVGITPTDYKHLSLNTQKLVNHIKEKNEIISAYRTYYENDK